jgi:peptidoglycan/LPS O-acetylase OafA/YrhL
MPEPQGVEVDASGPASAAAAPVGEPGGQVVGAPADAFVAVDEAPVVADEETGRGLAVRTIGFVPAFDGLRAIAVLFILDVHITGTFLPSIRSTFLPGGFLGVDIFFVLSGFLITAILLREFERTRTIKMGRFYLGRVLRLVPALVAFAVVHLLWAWSIGIPGDQERPALAGSVTYLSNWGISAFKVPGGLLGGPPGLGHLWSLAVEEQFYLVWPLIFFVSLALFRRRQVSLAVTGALIVIVAVHRAAAYTPGLGWLALYSRTDFRADSLLVGAFAAQLWVCGWLPKRGLKALAWLGVAVVAVSLLVAQDSAKWLYLGGYTGIALAVAFVLLAIVETDWVGSRLLSWRGLCALGVVSYGFYIWHPLAFAMVAYYGKHWATVVQIVAGVALAVALTLASWYLVERPFLRIKDRLRRGRDAVGTDRAPRPQPERRVA